MGENKKKQKNGEKAPRNSVLRRDFGPDVQWIPLDDLKPNPKQAANFLDLEDEEFNEFCKGIAEKGLKVPLEALPDGTLTSGHRRLRALRRLRCTHAPVRILRDLASAGDDAAEEELIKANLDRRNLGRLQQLRLHCRLLELAGRRKGARGEGEFRNELGHRVGMSGRNVDRYLPLTQLPLELQQAIDDAVITNTMGSQLLRLRSGAVDCLMQTIRGGAELRQSVASVIAAEKVPKPPQRRIFQCAKRAVRDWRVLVHNRDEFLRCVPLSWEQDIRRFHRVLGEALAQIADAKPRRVRVMRGGRVVGVIRVPVAER